MSEKSYEITPQENQWLKVDVTDEYGFKSTVYKETTEEAMEYVYFWWENAEEHKENNELHHKAMLNMIEIDKKYGIVSGNRDSLD